jgi:hypothetical protein
MPPVVFNNRSNQFFEIIKPISDSIQLLPRPNYEKEPSMKIIYRPTLNPMSVAKIRSYAEWAEKTFPKNPWSAFDAFASNCRSPRRLADAWREIAAFGWRYCDLWFVAMFALKKQRLIAERIIRHRYPSKLSTMLSERDFTLGIITEHSWRLQIFHRPGRTLLHATRFGFRREALQYAFRFGNSPIMVWAFNQLWHDQNLTTNDLAAAYWRFGHSDAQPSRITREELGRLILHSNLTDNNPELFRILIEGAKDLQELKRQALDKLAQDIADWDEAARLRGLFLLITHCQPDERLHFWGLLKHELLKTISWTSAVGPLAWPKLISVLRQVRQYGIVPDSELGAFTEKLHSNVLRLGDKEVERHFLFDIAETSEHLSDRLLHLLAEEATAIICACHERNRTIQDLKQLKSEFIDAVLLVDGSPEWEAKAFALLKQFAHGMPDRFITSTWNTSLNRLITMGCLPSQLTAAMADIVENHQIPTNLLTVIEQLEFIDPSDEQLSLIRRAAELLMTHPRASAEDRAKVLSYFPI